MPWAGRASLRPLRPGLWWPEEGAFVKKRTVTTIEIVERVVVSTAHTDTPRPHCPACAGAAMFMPEEAAAFARVTVRDIYARVEAGGFHFLETPGGLLLCADSLSQAERFDGPKELVCATNPVAETPTEKE
jgi:hypothetical protein